MPITTAPPSLTPIFRRLALARDSGGLTDGQLLGEFVRTGDPAAFEALIRRHGPMVLGVCRRVVRDSHLADDAFQAVWIVLARRAGVIRPREHVGNWLYGVAYHSALKARRSASRWKSREKQVIAMPHPVAPPASSAWSDLAPILDEELSRLPDILRLPVVLCDLEGRPQREAARQLEVPVTTLVTRLARARRMLAKRLTDRGVTLSGGALASVLLANAAVAAVPVPLTTTAVAVATSIAAGETAAAIPATVQYLSDGVLRMILISKHKAVSVTAIALVGLTLGIGVASLPTAAGQTGPANAKAKQPLAQAHSLDDVAFLRRACVDIRGTPPTDLELAMFRIDPDTKKRSKVVEWLLNDEKPKTVAAAIAYQDWLHQLNAANAYSGLSTRYAIQPLLNSTLTTATPTLSGITTTLMAHDSHLSTAYNLTMRPYITNLPVLYAQQPPPTGKNEQPGKKESGAAIQYENIYRQQVQQAGQKRTTPPDDAERAKLLKEIAAMQANLEKLELEYQIRQKQIEADKEKKRRVEETKKITGELEILTAKLKLLEAENARSQQKKYTGEKTKSAEDNRKAAEAWLKSTIASEKAAVTQALLAAKQKKLAAEEFFRIESTDESAFLKRVVKECYGVPPTALELKYFTEDKDPKKREKLVDLILKDQSVAKKLGPDARKKLLAEQTPRPGATLNVTASQSLLQNYYTAKTSSTDPFAKLLDQVLDGKRSDEQIADAICLATLGRYPSESEQKITLAAVAGAPDHRAAWQKVAVTLAGTKEAQAHAELLKKK
ncbi:MAG TPA: sigma-70 family RNA polymerase sigma factor [Fimbriiglobus sp.]|jgi:RNA polymerase sigma factor (sigma-70 family)